jgi:hypothetical protein
VLLDECFTESEESFFGKWNEGKCIPLKEIDLACLTHLSALISLLFMMKL